MSEWIWKIVFFILVIPAIPFVLYCMVDDAWKRWREEVTLATDKHYGK